MELAEIHLWPRLEQGVTQEAVPLAGRQQGGGHLAHRPGASPGVAHGLAKGLVDARICEVRLEGWHTPTGGTGSGRRIRHWIRHRRRFGSLLLLAEWRRATRAMPRAP